MPSFAEIGSVLGVVLEKYSENVQNFTNGQTGAKYKLSEKLP